MLTAGTAAAATEALCSDVAARDHGSVEATSPPDATTDVDQGLREAQRLEPMLGVVLAYGGEHPDTFSTYGLVWHSPEDASVVVGFTDQLDEHRANLADLVPIHDELIVCRGALTDLEARELQAELGERYGDRLSSLGISRGRLTMTVRSSEEALAAELRERYGEQLELSIGLFPYPMPEPPPPSQCESMPPAATSLDVDARVERVDPLTTTTPDPPSAEIVLTNTGNEPAHLEFGAAPPALLARPGESTAVNAFELGVPAILQTIDLAPGASERLTVGVGLASCDPTAGYRVPPGDYQLIVLIDDVATDPYLIDRPDLVASAAVHEPPLFSLLEGTTDRGIADALGAVQQPLESVAALIEDGKHRAAAEQFIDNVALGPGWWAQLPESFRAVLEQNAATYLDELHDPTALSIDTAALVATALPLLLTYGTASPRLFPAVIDELAVLVPAARIEVLDGAGHIPHATHPDQWTATLLAFHEQLSNADGEAVQ
jgi:pimeloyl-ACP methyl ester carboxylesterase